MKISYALLHNMNETHISFEAIRPSSNSCKHEFERDIICKADKICKQKKNKRKNNVVRGFKRMCAESM